MAVLRFFFSAQFRKSLSEFRKQKKRVIPEAIIAARLAHNNAAHDAGEHVRNANTIARGGNCADKLRPASEIGNSCEFVEKLAIIGFIASVFSWLRRRVTSRVNPRSPIQCVNFNARIIGN